jgi:hypothetical protein
MSQSRCFLTSLLSCAMVLALISISLPANAQTDSGSVSGLITDPTGAAVAGAHLRLIDIDRNTTSEMKSNGAGFYSFASVHPGRYRIEVEHQGFRIVHITDLTVNTQDSLQENVRLEVGSVSESVTVSAEGANINTTDGSVSTVIDRQFLAEIPLNGRSIQTLLMLAPGVVFTEGGATSSQGQFSVNGMRTDANYFAVDGVAANLGTDQVGNGLGEAAAGSVPGFNAIGGSNSLVSVDAMQEFRIQTSSFAPEYGRTPGAQVSIVTRSGTNFWHGTAFDYLRNDLLDANNWFADHDHLPKAEERQNDFGGVIGGPIIKDHTYFFFSYEGLRLREPVTLQSVVPDQTARTTAPAALQPFLNAYPMPNAPELTDNLAGYNASVSNPSTVDAYSIRVDQSIGSNLTLFGRYAYSPSATASAGAPGSTSFTPNNSNKLSVATNTFTLGLNERITDRITNELRINYSNLKSQGTEELSTLGGAVPPSNADLSQIYAPGIDPAKARLAFFILDGSGYFSGPSGVSEQRQINVVDNVSLVKHSHLVKFGADVRWLAPFEGSRGYSMSTYFGGINGPGGVLSGQTLFAFVSSFGGVSVRAKNFSLYGQDTWKLNPRLNLTYGMRWDVNPAPVGNSRANDPLVVAGLNNPATMTVAPRGTPLYSTTYWNFSPRFGAAYQIAGEHGRETVLRGGIGAFYDIGSGSLGSYSLGYPFSAFNFFNGANFPLTPQQAAPPTVDLSGPAGFLTVADPHLALPRTYQWNLAVEQSLGQNQTVSVTYLGTLGRKLLRNYTLYPPNPNFSSGVIVTTNSGASNYQALQVKFQRQVSHGLQALASYTYSHSIDNASDDYNGYSPGVLGSPSIDRGNSAFDVRHAASGALIYSLPEPAGHGLLHALFGGWDTEDLLIARTAFPVDLAPDFFFVGPYPYYARPNVNPGVPFYLYGSQYPGGKAFNPAAFSDAGPGTQGNLGRNTLRGFGAWQDNFAVRRQFNITERVHMQFRAEAFNLFNHPNFADPPGSFSLNDPLFGVTTSTLANGASAGGLNPLYQIGAPRSWQFGLKLQF